MSQQTSKTKEGSFTKSFLINLAPLFKLMEKKQPLEETFFFYPNKIKGFVESCILGSQRSSDSTASLLMMIYDVTTAMDIHLKQIASQVGSEVMNVIEDKATDARSTDDLTKAVEIVAKEIAGFDRHEKLADALGVAELINDYVRNEMRLIEDALGAYSVNPKAFDWTNARAVKVELTFGSL